MAVSPLRLTRVPLWFYALAIPFATQALKLVVWQVVSPLAHPLLGVLHWEAVWYALSFDVAALMCVVSGQVTSRGLGSFVFLFLLLHVGALVVAANGAPSWLVPPEVQAGHTGVWFFRSTLGYASFCILCWALSLVPCSIVAPSLVRE